jgi:hypothetical protein
MPSPPRALVDANVIFSNHLRNLLLQLAANDAFEVHWSAEIEQEWLRNMEERTRDQIRRHTLPLIRDYFPNAVVVGFDPDLVTGSTVRSLLRQCFASICGSALGQCGKTIVPLTTRCSYRHSLPVIAFVSR